MTKLEPNLETQLPAKEVSDSSSCSIQFREHRGSLDESMKTCREVPKMPQLQQIVHERYGLGKVTVKPYAYDHRIDWDTQIVCLDGNAVGFTSGPFESNAKGDARPKPNHSTK